MIGLLYGIIPLSVFIVSWLFGLSVVFLRIVGLLGVLGIIGFLGIWAIGKIMVMRKIRGRRDKYMGNLDRYEIIVIFFIGAFLVVNFIGVLAPEVGFDALWYHLTIPKIFLQQSRVDFIPGGLYYYSAMPKLTEIWYMVSLVFDQTGTLAKAIHYLYGVGSLVLLYRFVRKLLPRVYALMAVLGLISALGFGWESGSAYIDLAWTFYTLLAVYLYYIYTQNRNIYSILLVGVASGLAIGTKLPAIIPTIVLLLLAGKQSIKQAIVFAIGVIFISSPWFIFAWLKTGNPVYPLLTNIYPHENVLQGIGLVDFIKTTWLNITWPQDPFSLFVGITAIIFLFPLKRFRKTDNLSNLTNWLNLLFITNYATWYLFFRTSGSRFLLSLLPIWIIICLTRWSLFDRCYYKLLLGIALVSSTVNLVYRSVSTFRVLPVVLGKENRQDYLLSRLNFDYGDFYDRDGKIKTIVGDNPVLVFGYHNMFYADFRYIHASTTDKQNGFRYWLSDKEITQCFSCRLVYSDKPTNVYLYSLSEFAKI